MAINPNDVGVASINGASITDVAQEQSTIFGLTVQLRGANVTPSSVTCTVKRGSETVALTPTVESGAVSATLTPANLTTLGAGRLDVLVAYWTFTVTDGTDAQPVERTQYLGVGDGQLFFPVLYDEFVDEVPQVGKACAKPSGEDNFWRQVRLGIQDLRVALNRQQADVKTYVLASHDELRHMTKLHAWPYILGTMISSSNNQGVGWFHELRQEKMGQIAHAWASLVVTVKETSTTFSNDDGGGRRAVQAKAVRTWTQGPQSGIGGPW